MWCTYCQQEVPAELTDCLSLQCTYCSTPELAARAPDFPLHFESPSLADLEEDSSLLPGAPSYERLTSTSQSSFFESRNSFRMNPTETISPENYISRIDELRGKARADRQLDHSQNEIESPRVAGFFIVVFVFGFLMSQWAMYLGHTAAWIAGLVFSVAGLSIAIGSMTCQLRHQKRSLVVLLDDQPVQKVLSKPHYSFPDESLVIEQKVSA